MRRVLGTEMRRRGQDFRRPVRRRISNVVWWTLCGIAVLIFIVILSKVSQIESRPTFPKRYGRHDRIMEGLNITDEMLGANSVTRQLTDQISLAKAFVVIAKESNNLQFAWELSAQIRNSQVLLSNAATRRTPLTTRETENAIHDMALLLYQAQQFHYDSATMIMRLKAKIQALEEQMGSVNEKSSKYGQIAAEEVPKSLYCLGVRLTTEWFRNLNLHRKLKERMQMVKLTDNNLYHFCVFSDNILATWVVVRQVVEPVDKCLRDVFRYFLMFILEIKVIFDAFHLEDKVVSMEGVLLGLVYKRRGRMVNAGVEEGRMGNAEIEDKVHAETEDDDEQRVC